MHCLMRPQLGVPLVLAFPLVAYAGAAILGLSSALAASMYPAHRASKIDVVEALQYE